MVWRLSSPTTSDTNQNILGCIYNIIVVAAATITVPCYFSSETPEGGWKVLGLALYLRDSGVFYCPLPKPKLTNRL